MDFLFCTHAFHSTIALLAMGANGASVASHPLPVPVAAPEFRREAAPALSARSDDGARKPHRVVLTIDARSLGVLPRSEFD